MEKSLWTAERLAKQANVSARFVRAEIKAGRLKAEKLGHIWVIADEEARRWLSHETGRKRKVTE
jgi:hypothetical protein